MNKENTEKLYKEFPDLYIQKKLPMTQTCMCWGFECDDGWFNIIYELSKKLSKTDGLAATQVKEKYGTLRFYCNGYNDAVDKAIGDACRESANTCEVCGDKGKLRYNSYIKTLCDEHNED